MFLGISRSTKALLWVFNIPLACGKDCGLLFCFPNPSERPLFFIFSLNLEDSMEKFFCLMYIELYIPSIFGLTKASCLCFTYQIWKKLTISCLISHYRLSCYPLPQELSRYHCHLSHCFCSKCCKILVILEMQGKLI